MNNKKNVSEFGDISFNELSSYYKKYRELYELHNKLGFGNAPDLPSGFSEHLCREIYGFKKSENKECDAIDSNGNRIEIKATSSCYGQTSISSLINFDYLYWLYFDLEKNILTVSIFPEILFASYKSYPNIRKPITLSNIRNKSTTNIKEDITELSKLFSDN